MSMPRAARSVATSTRSCPLRKFSSDARARVLRLVAVHRLDADRRACELARDAVRAVLGAGEHDRALHVLVRQQPRQQRALVGVLDEVHGLLERAPASTRPRRRRRAPGRAGAPSAAARAPRASWPRTAASGAASASARAMRLIAGRKPRSSMRSASSSTRISIASRVTWRCCSRSSSRPGVATSTLAPVAQRLGLRLDADAAEGDGVAQPELAPVARRSRRRSAPRVRALAKGPARAPSRARGSRRVRPRADRASAARTLPSCRCPSGRRRARRGQRAPAEWRAPGSGSAACSPPHAGRAAAAGKVRGRRNPKPNPLGGGAPAVP